MGTVANIITSEERTMLRDYLLLTHMQVMVQKDITDIKLSGNLLTRAYTMCAKLIEDRIFQDMKSLRIALKERGIQVSKEEQNSDGFIVRYHFTCRGYADNFAMTRDVMRSEIGIRFGKYTSEIGTFLRPYRK